MDFLENVYKKTAMSTVKVGKIMFKRLLRPIVRATSQVVVATCLQKPLTDLHNLNFGAFMTIIIKVDSSRLGWQKGVLVALKNCKGARFKMDQNGVVEISGVGDPMRLLEKIGRSSRVTLLWFQFGQCSENLYMAASSGKKSDPPAAKEIKPIGYGNNDTRFPFLPNMHAGFAHPVPHLLTPYGPY
ncbi:uncharacterized protein LOC142538032 [Primulina tabacum]|uniref:uncharacterized protein LOC142538032 n=1 Tax=Primulina tabacum TaxID=48773 RepID=UPI003F5A2175